MTDRQQTAVLCAVRTTLVSPLADDGLARGSHEERHETERAGHSIVIAAKEARKGG